MGAGTNVRVDLATTCDVSSQSMRALLQRVTHGSVRVAGSVVGEIGQGLVVLLGVGESDTEAVARKLAEKIARLRIFNDDQGKFNLSLLDIEGEALVISQFTLYADTRRGRRPSFIDAAEPGVAEPLCDRLTYELAELGVRKVATGQFGAMMKVEIHNDGPVTVWLDTEHW